MRLLTFLESVESDRENAAYARKVADGIQNYLDLHQDSKVWGMKPMQREGGIVTITMGVIPDMLRKLDWSEDDLAPLENLHLLFISENESELAGGYGKWQGNPIIILELLHPEKPMTYVNTRFSGRKKHFMHELTHHLDSVRTQDKAMGIAGRFKPEELKHNMAAYLSNPKEFNAYFIEVLEELDSVFGRVIPKIEATNPEAARTLAQHVLGNSFQEFVNKLTNQMFGPEFVMDDKYRKKFVRRLAKHYMDIVNTLRAKGLMESDWAGGTGNLKLDMMLKRAKQMRKETPAHEDERAMLTKNPSPQQVMAIAQKVAAGELGATRTGDNVQVKGLLNPTTGDFWVWNPNFAIHGDIEEHLVSQTGKPGVKDWMAVTGGNPKEDLDQWDTRYISYSGVLEDDGRIKHWMPYLKASRHPSVLRALKGTGWVQEPKQ